MITALELSKELGCEVLETERYFGIILGKEYPIVVYVEKSVVNSAQENQKCGYGLPWTEFPQMIREMNLGFRENNTSILWGRFLGEVQVAGAEQYEEFELEPVGFILTEPEEADAMLLITFSALLENQLAAKSPNNMVLKTYDERRREEALYYDIDDTDDGESLFVLPLGCVNMELDPDTPKDSSYGLLESLREERAKGLAVRFRAYEKVQEDEEMCFQSKVKEFSCAAKNMQAEFQEICRITTDEFWRHCYPNQKKEFLHDSAKGGAFFLGQRYSVQDEEAALQSLTDAFEIFRAKWEDFWEESAKLDKFRGFLQKYPIEVEDYFGVFSRGMEIPNRYESRYRVYLHKNGVNLRGKKGFIAFYSATDEGFEAFTEQINKELRRSWRFRYCAHRYMTLVK